MQDVVEKSISFWMATAKPPQEPALARNLEVDVCIVGGGISGMTTAYLLAKEGASVVVIDDGPIASGQTQRTTAHLSNAIDDRYYEIERMHGQEGSRLAAESHSAAIDTIESIVLTEGIDCDFRRLDGFLFLPPGSSKEELDRELAAAHRAGLAQVEFVDRAPTPGFDTGPCLKFPRQAQFHPLRYIAGLTKCIERALGLLFADTHAEKIEGGAVAKVHTNGGAIVTARSVVVATNTPINDSLAIHTKQAPYMTYVVAGRIPAGAAAWALYWDTLDPYHYVRFERAASDPLGVPDNQSSQDDLLIVGGEDHKTGQADDQEERYARLETWARERFPALKEIEYRWSGQVMESQDGLGFIGRNPGDADNVYIATGDSGMGMTHGTIAGMLLRDLIQGKENPWARLYDPSRKTLKAAGEFVKENVNVALQYGDWLTGGDVAAATDVKPGSGAILRRGLSKIAAYKDESGTMHECSAVCPHLGCVVRWNDGEKTWDCPCHGSRFDRLGKVIAGPANVDLAKAPQS